MDLGISSLWRWVEVHVHCTHTHRLGVQLYLEAGQQVLGQEIVPTVEKETLFTDGQQHSGQRDVGLVGGGEEQVSVTHVQ